MNPTRPNNLIIHNDSQRILVPWNWLMRVFSEKSTSTVTLVFSGLCIQVTTLKPFELLAALDNGNVHRIRVAPVKEPAETDFVVDSVAIYDENDE